MALKKENYFNPSDITVERILIIRSRIDQEEFVKNIPPEGPQPPPLFALKLAHKTGFNREKQAGRVRLFISAYGADRNNKPLGVGGEFIFDFHFKIENFHLYEREKDGHMQMSAFLGANMISVAYGTARGLVWNAVAHTFLEGLILPVIDAMEFLKEGELKTQD
ncbi:MAG: hypothetical protein GXO27_02965 [Chlorobi bacterium]|nr:hypothetical protein [Chlorobiota bacterium]